jgi:alginate O-acetyltransferase complex protein AlgI
MVVTVAVFWSLPNKLRDMWIGAVTIAFLINHSPESALILAIFIVVTYFGSNGKHMIGARVIAISTVIIVVLVYFKIKAAYTFTGAVDELLIPLGLSYYSFRCIHYLIEKYKGTLADHTLQDFSNYLLFLPTILAGPIHRFGPYERDARRRRWDPAKFAQGLERILYGYVKVSLLAGYLLADYAGSLISGFGPESPGIMAYLTMLQKGFIGYLLFSGYSDIAIGFALTLGYRVMENFNWPFLAQNISEFWRRWHISLSSWCREYIYTVVLSLTRRPALGAIAAMLVLGLWHEISIRYILWGAYHGLGTAVWQRFQDVKQRLPAIENEPLRLGLRWLSIAFTFHYVMFGFVMVQEDTLESAMAVYRAVLWEIF